MNLRRVVSRFAIIVLLLCAAKQSLAQEPFYKGKALRIIVGTSAGGGFDTYTRTIARHFGKHVPGQPTIVVENMPGAGHLMLGRRQKGLVFLIALPVMFAIGLALDGRLFPFVFSEPLVGLAAIANLGMGLTYFIAKGLALGKGVVTAASYEYGNTFLIVSGLLNMLVAIDAYDVRLGRK